MSAGAPPPSAIDPLGDVAVTVGPPRDDAKMARRERLQVLVHSKSFIAGAIIVGFWVLCAIFGELLVLQDPFASNPLNALTAPNADYWFGTDRLGPRRVLAGHRRLARHHDHRARGDAARHGPRHRPRASSRATSAAPSTTC